MANQRHVDILVRDGVGVWNLWRKEEPGSPDLSRAFLYKADLHEADLSRTYLEEANLRGADLHGADLHEADLSRTYLEEADLRRADLHGADLRGADLKEADLIWADLRGANLTRANLTRANLTGAYLMGAHLSRASLRGANLNGADLSGAHLSRADLSGATCLASTFSSATLTDCTVYGISAWDVNMDGAKQTDLRITPGNQETNITTDNLEVAQFLYLLLHNEKIRHVIDTITSKVVLILGRFTPERKAVLDALREALRQHEPAYVPVLFDFEGSTERNFTETVTLLARMARFIIADITDPASVPKELEAIVPHVQVPVRPIIAQGTKPYAMFADYRLYRWMLDLYSYADRDTLIAAIEDEIIAPAEAKITELRALRQ